MIVCENLTRDFGAIRAVDGLTFTVPAGKVFALLGANGAGKTTTIHLLLGILAPGAGRAEVLGLNPWREGDRLRAQCGVLLEHHGLYERLTGEENLELYARIAQLAPPARAARLRELLEHFGLWERRKERVGRWSRGMKQKLAIARAILARPPLVFLDEPTAGLDPEAVVRLREDIAALAREGATVFLNTHNLTDAEKLADLVGVMRAGRLLALGTPAELRSRSGTTVTISGSGLAEGTVRAEVLAASDTTLTLRLKADASVAPIVRELVERGAAIEEVRREAMGLEDVFLQIVGANEEESS
jgi:ABC-2 type transport system ATP-binding protein